MESLPARGALRRQRNRETSWRKTWPPPRRRGHTKGKSYSSLALPYPFSIDEGRKVTYHRRRLRQLPAQVLPDFADFFVDGSNLDRHAKRQCRMLRQHGERVVHVLERE